MPHRELLTESQRLSLQTPASDERGMVRHYTRSVSGADKARWRGCGRPLMQLRLAISQS